MSLGLLSGIKKDIHMVIYIYLKEWMLQLPNGSLGLSIVTFLDKITPTTLTYQQNLVNWLVILLLNIIKVKLYHELCYFGSSNINSMYVNVDDAFVGFNYKKETTKKITKKMIKKDQEIDLVKMKWLIAMMTAIISNLYSQTY